MSEGTKHPSLESGRIEEFARWSKPPRAPNIEEDLASLEKQQDQREQVLTEILEKLREFDDRDTKLRELETRALELLIKKLSG